MEDGSDRPIWYVSRTIAPAEKNYSVIKKGGLAIIFAHKKFHQNLIDRKFTFYADHDWII